MRRLTSLDFLVEQELRNFLEGWGHPVIPPAGFTTLCVWNITLNSLFCGSSLAKTPDSFPIYLSSKFTQVQKKMCLPSFQLAMDQKPGTLVLTSKIAGVHPKLWLSFSKAWYPVTPGEAPNSWDLWIFQSFSSNIQKFRKI
jgi:hypothetical protein